MLYYNIIKIFSDKCVNIIHCSTVNIVDSIYRKPAYLPGKANIFRKALDVTGKILYNNLAVRIHLYEMLRMIDIGPVPYKFFNIKFEYATVAQLVEQRIRNAQVVGSSPTSSSRSRKRKDVWRESQCFELYKALNSKELGALVCKSRQSHSGRMLNRRLNRKQGFPLLSSKSKMLCNLAVCFLLSLYRNGFRFDRLYIGLFCLRMTTPPDVVLFSYIGGRFVCYLLLLVWFIASNINGYFTFFNFKRAVKREQGAWSFYGKNKC